MAVKKKDRPRHLGRGLESLISPITSEEEKKAFEHPVQTSNFPPDKDLAESMREVPLDSVEANPYQPRSRWDEQELAELADSIRANGVIQPIVVRAKDDKFELIAGERRLRGAKLAGLQVIPALVRQASDEQLLELALVENIQRSDLNPIERAKAYYSYMETFSLTQADAAKRLGQSRSVIANYLRLLDLPVEVKEMLTEGRLDMGHARALLSLPTEQLRRKLANRALAGRLSVREVERLVRNHLQGTKKKPGKVIGKPAHIIDLERKLAEQLGTKVAIQARKGGRRGKVVIEFYSLEEFDRITEMMGLTAVERF